jgi:hypothetical protein
VKNNNDASVKERVRAILLREAAEIAPEWQWRIEREEELEAERLWRKDAGLGQRPSRLDDERDARMSELAMRKLNNDQALKALEDLPQIGRPSRMEMYREHKREALRAFPDDEPAARKRFRALSKLKPKTARNTWRMLELADENKMSRKVFGRAT